MALYLKHVSVASFQPFSFHLFSFVWFRFVKPLSRISNVTGLFPGSELMFRTSVAFPEATSNLFLHYVSRINLVVC